MNQDSSNNMCDKYLIEDIQNSFSNSPLPPKKLSISYKIAIFFSTIIMLILPLIYLGLIGGIAYYVYHFWNVTYPNLSYYDQEPLFPAIFSFMAAVLCLFMVKPIFARMPKAAKDLRILPGQEPVLEELIRQICAKVNAPYPAEISLSRDVNASASLRNGIWSLFRNDLRLTIGLPLIHGLKTQELSEVLAHEFGHFAQGVGMKSTYITRSINFWFLRVIYQRDRFDVWLDKATKSMPDIRLTVFFWAMQALIWCTRAILKVLMWIGQAVSCHTLRQMEYDADHHAARIVGSDVFEKTSRRMNALMIGQQIGFNTTKVMWMEKILPNKLARLTCKETSEIDKDKLDAFIEEQAKEAKAQLFDTHPTDAERSRAVEKLALPGVLHIEGEADNLIIKSDQYDALVTKMFYEQECEFDLNQCKLLDDTQMDQRHEEVKIRGKSMEKWFLDATGMLCPIPVEAWKFPDFVSEEASDSELRALTEQIDEHKEFLAKELETLNETNIHLLRGYILTCFLDAGLTLKEGAFDMKNPTRPNAINLRHQSEAIMTKALSNVNKIQILLVKRLMQTLVLRTHQNPEITPEVNELIAFIYHLTPFINEVQKLNLRSTPLIQLLNAIAEQEVPETTINFINNEAIFIKQALARLWAQAEGISYPLNEDKKSLQELAFGSASQGESGPFDAVADADELIDKTHQFYVDALAQFAVLAEDPLAH